MRLSIKCMSVCVCVSPFLCDWGKGFLCVCFHWLCAQLKISLHAHERMKGHRVAFNIAHNPLQQGHANHESMEIE